MKAITVWQPWATLLATGQKHNETRSWKTSYRGEILIHAAKTDHSGILLHIPMEELKHFQDAGVVNKLPTGAIIGFFLWYYIVRCEYMKRGVWWKRGGDNGKR